MTEGVSETPTSVPKFASWLASQQNQDAIELAFALREFALHSFYTQAFHVSEDWTRYVVPSNSGQTILDHSGEITEKFTQPQISMALFLYFFHNDLLIDVERSNLQAIMSLFDIAFRKTSLRLPYVFGHLLYRKFNDPSLKFDHQPEFLNSTAAEKLLNESPQGVFQQSNVVSGPLGLMFSKEKRCSPPTNSLGLWHCPDPGCQALHKVVLRSPPTEVTKVLTLLFLAAPKALGRSPDWHQHFLSLHRRRRPRLELPYTDLPCLIGDCIVANDRLALTIAALRSEHGTLLRETLKKIPEHKRLSSGSPEEVAGKLDEYEQHQLLMLIPDAALIPLLDASIKQRKIHIPASEYRTPHTYVHLLRNDPPSRISSLGVRATRRPPSLALAAKIWDTYEALGIQNELAWRLDRCPPSQARTRLFEFIRTAGATRTAKRLIINDQKVFLAIAEGLNLSLFDGEPEEELVPRLLWKLGFNPHQFEHNHSLLRERLSDFQECLTRVGSTESEDCRAAIRASGVNLFVSVEVFLESLVKYNTWLLASDHFQTNNFIYNETDASHSVVDSLGDKIEIDGHSFSWQIDGSNPLGTLLLYLSRLNDWAKEGRNRDKKPFRRKEGDFPHYASDPVQLFPFKHVQLWADVDTEGLEEYLTALGQISRKLAKADLAFVRNGLDHKRDANKFPSLDRMSAAASLLLEAFNAADIERYIPKFFWVTRSETDWSGNVEYTLTDYRGRPLIIHEPNLVVCAPRPVFGRPIIVAPSDLLRQPNSTLMFSVEKDSVFARYWKTYPRRRETFVSDWSRDGTSWS